MTDADRDQMEGKVDQAKGNFKEGVGNLTGDEDTKAEGQADQAKGGLKESVGKAKEAISQGINKLRGNR